MVKLSNNKSAAHPQISVVNICDLMFELYGPDYFNTTTSRSWDEESKAVIDWCDEHNAYYYAACREDFSIYDAANQAEKAGKILVVVEDMS